MKVHTIDYPDYKTARQWAKQGFLPLEGAKGIELWVNRFRPKKYIYYSFDEVAEASVEQLSEFFRPERERQKAKSKVRRQRKKVEHERQLKKAERLAAERQARIERERMQEE